MGKPVRTYTDETGEVLVVLREQDYMDLIAMQFPEEDEELQPKFVDLLHERKASLEAGNVVIRSVAGDEP
jgi:PHD/YefM family antitoxin component YafN of YafNO toxin-antitoxin module